MPRWRLTRRKRRYDTLLGALIFILIVLVTCYHHSDLVLSASSYSEQTARPRSHHLLPQQAQFWRSLYALLQTNDPKCQKKPDAVVPRKADSRFDADRDRARPDVLWIDPPDIERMKAAHTNFIIDLRSLLLTKSLVYEPDTKGIVTTTAESMLAVLSISLLMLRRTRSTLPVEVFLSKPTPYTETFCNQVFPALDATCVYISHVFSMADTTTIDIHSYQYKIFAILFSSFESILFLDADAFPISDPEPFFSRTPFNTTGLVLWPDFWYPSESPYFFQIAHITRPPRLADRPTTESGEIMYNKTTHAAGILLATYYNFYGPDYYYLLQSQESAGMGDKETFLWSAIAVNEPFYFVREPVRSLGRWDTDKDKGWIGSAMVQFDPSIDHILDLQRQAEAQAEAERKPFKDPEDIAHPRVSTQVKIADPDLRPKPLFLHANHPKFDPYTIFTTGDPPPTKDSNGSWVRCWGPPEDTLAMFGIDIEARFWEVAQEMACERLLGLWLGVGRPSRDALEQVRRRDQGVCDVVKKYRRDALGFLKTE